MVAWHHFTQMNENEPNNMYKGDKQSQNNNRTSWDGSSMEWMAEDWLRQSKRLPERQKDRVKKGKYLFIFVSFTSLDLSLCTTNGRLVDKQRPKYVSSTSSSTSFRCVAISSTQCCSLCVCCVDYEFGNVSHYDFWNQTIQLNENGWTFTPSLLHSDLSFTLSFARCVQHDSKEWNECKQNKNKERKE